VRVPEDAPDDPATVESDLVRRRDGTVGIRSAARTGESRAGAAAQCLLLEVTSGPAPSAPCSRPWRVADDPARRHDAGLVATRPLNFSKGMDGPFALVQTCELNGLDPRAYLADMLARLAAGHPANRLDEPLSSVLAAEPKRDAA
jgi:hypothetical protein